jgi:hypothetical protein
MAATYRIKQGDCLSSLAKRFGFADYKTIYDHPENARLKQQRYNPNVLFPGDDLFIPDVERKEVDAASEKTHRFQLKTNKTLLRLLLKDSDETPFANLRYELTIDQQTFEGVTNGEGKLEQKIPADAKQGLIVLYESSAGGSVVSTVPLHIGDLDPVEELTGVQSRLNNLGIGCGKVDGEFGPKTEAALTEFQRRHGLARTGRPDPPTIAKLRLLHDWQ